MRCKNCKRKIYPDSVSDEGWSHKKKIEGHDRSICFPIMVAEPKRVK